VGLLGQLFQLLEYFQRLLLLPGHRVGMSEERQEQWGLLHEAGALKLLNGPRELSPVQEG